MWYYAIGAIALKVIYGKGKRAWLGYKSLKDLRAYGESVKIPYVPGEDVEAYRKRLIEARNRNSGTK